MAAETHLQDITHTIQLAIAPVFLLTALGTTLAVLTNRLSRNVDRARRVELRLVAEATETREASLGELKMLSFRARLVLYAITAGVTAALLVCLLIAAAFLGYLFNADFGVAVAIFFLLAIAAFVLSLLFFLREVSAAIATLQFGLPPEIRAAPKDG
jgi:hypothetical protein